MRTLSLRLPPPPTQVNVYVASERPGLTDSVPKLALDPLQEPLAVQLEALVDDQVSVLDWPLVTVLGLAVIVTVGEVPVPGRCQPTGL